MKLREIELIFPVVHKKLLSHVNAMQEIRNRNNIQYLKKQEIFFSFSYLSAVWLLFGQNPIEIIVDKIFVLDFAKIVTKQLIYKQN